MNDKAKNFKAELEEMGICTPVRCNLQGPSTYEFEVDLEIKNPAWGMPSEFEELLIAFDASVCDFSHVSEDSITVYVEMDDN